MAAMRRVLRVATHTLIGIAWVLNIVYAVREPIWSPRDEIAHFDYIERLSEGVIPDPRADISPHTLALSSTEFSWIMPSSFDGSARSMGIAGKSYEAEQPPLYYALLSVPHRLLKVSVAPASDVRVLRLISLSFLLLATILVLMSASRAAVFAPSLAALLQIAALMLSITNIGTYATLGNDSLSALGGALVLYLLVRTLEARESSAPLFFLSVAVATLVLFVKPTNAALVLAPIALAVLPGQAPSGRSLKRLASALGPLAVVGAYGLSRLLSSGGSGLGSFAAREYFASWVKGDANTLLFLRSLMCESLNLSHLGVWAPPTVGVVLGVAFLISVLCFAFTASKWPSQTSTLVGVALGIAALTFIGAAALNRWAPGVHWSAFRHYVGILPFFVVAALAPLHRLSRSGVTIALGLACLATTCVLAAQAKSLPEVGGVSTRRPFPEQVDFDGGPTSQAQLSGWSGSERTSDGVTFSWVDGPEATLRILLPRPSGCRVRFRAWPFAYPASPPQQMTLFVNGNQVGDAGLGEAPAEYAFESPRSVWRNGQNELRLRFARAESPRDHIPGTTDGRRLAAAIDWIRIEPKATD